MYDEFSDVISNHTLGNNSIVLRLMQMANAELDGLLGFSKDDIEPIDAYWSELLYPANNSRIVIGNSRSRSSVAENHTHHHVALVLGLLPSNKNSHVHSTARGNSNMIQNTNRSSFMTQSGFNILTGSSEGDLLFFRILPGVITSELSLVTSTQSYSSGSSIHPANNTNELLENLQSSLTCQEDSISSLASCIRLLIACSVLVYNSTDCIAQLLTAALEMPSQHVLDCYEDFYR